MKMQQFIFYIFSGYMFVLMLFGLQMFLNYYNATDIQVTERMQLVTNVDPLSLKPIEREVNFLGNQVQQSPLIETIKTDLACYSFSNVGAVLERLEFKQQASDNLFVTIEQSPTVFGEKLGAFFVALKEKTPIYYNLVQKRESEDAYRIAYQTETDDVILQKTFVISKKSYKIDLTLNIEPKKRGASAELRLFYPAPSLIGAPKPDNKTGLVNERDDKIVEVPNKDEMFAAFWKRPTFFGLEDRYFVHTLVKDQQGFVQRAYFSLENEQLFAILESPSITEKTEWTISFYCGPKESAAMQAVDERLEQTLNYGWWLGFITKYFAQLVRYLMDLLYTYTRSYGWAIILLTAFIKLALLPITYRGEEQMKQRSVMDKKMAYIESKYKGNPEALAEARAELVKKHGITGISSCLPLFLQVPIFLGFSWVVNNAIELYKVPFLWISDLSSPDHYYIVPVLIAVSVIIQGSFSSNDVKQHLSSTGMGLFIGALSCNFSAGLALYFFINTVVSIIQILIMKRIKL